MPIQSVFVIIAIAFVFTICEATPNDTNKPEHSKSTLTHREKHPQHPGTSETTHSGTDATTHSGTGATTHPGTGATTHSGKSATTHLKVPTETHSGTGTPRTIHENDPTNTPAGEHELFKHYKEGDKITFTAEQKKELKEAAERNLEFLRKEREKRKFDTFYSDEEEHSEEEHSEEEHGGEEHGGEEHKVTPPHPHKTIPKNGEE